jgi:hypothetical protein
VHELTSNACVHLKHLYDFKDMMDLLLEKSPDFKQSVLGEFTSNHSI